MNQQGMDQEVYDKVKAPFTTLAASGLMGAQMFMGSHERADRNSAENDRRQGQEMQARTQALDSMNHAQLEKVFQDDWIDRASIREISSTYALTRDLGSRDHLYKEAGERIERLVRERYGVDPAATRDVMELERALHASDRPSKEGHKTVRDAQSDEMIRQADMVEHELHDHAPQSEQSSRTDSADMSEQPSTPDYASPERLRREMERLRATGLSEAQTADAVRVQLGNAKPVNEAAQAGAAGRKTQSANMRANVGKTMGKTRGLSR